MLNHVIKSINKFLHSWFKTLDEAMSLLDHFWHLVDIVPCDNRNDDDFFKMIQRIPSWRRTEIFNLLKTYYIGSLYTINNAALKKMKTSPESNRKLVVVDEW